MKTILKARHMLGMIALISMSATAQVNDIEGQIDSVDVQAQTLTVQGITVHVTDATDFDDDLNRLEDLSEGDSVEIEYEYENSRHVAKEIERDD